ncbi:MAG: NAD(P)/FAD-dependent oxidoreductase [Solirubrobacterales bacterium]|nr:NAD(P)/FAD-dependent oxidoreductase [Solirubrobacterales bacterium]
MAALEALLALRELAGHRLELTLLSPEREFQYRPVTVAEAFDRGEARSYDLAGIVVNHVGGRIVWGSLIEVDPNNHVAITDAGDQIPFDSLVIATGAIMREALPGALTFRGRADVSALRGMLGELEAGTARSIVLALPAQRMWTLPIYELALMTAAYLRERGADAVKVSVVTPEEEPLELFGPVATKAISPLLHARGIVVRTSSLPALLRGRALLLAGSGEVYTDKVIALPQLEGPRLPGLPHDHHGFIPVDVHGRVSDVDDVYAAGDVTTFPLKQGGLAAQQADAVAEMVAAELGVPIAPAPFRPVLRGLLMTGGAPLYLRADPQLLARASTVAVDARRLHLTRGETSSAAGQPLWWPPAKIAARYLAPYLATARPRPLSSRLLADRAAAGGQPVSDLEHADALELALLLADCDARWGDYRSALQALDAAEALQGALPPEYEAKRREWRAAERGA